MRTIDADALSAFVGDLRSTLHKEQSTFKAMTEIEFNTRDYMLLNFQQTIDNAPTVERPQGERAERALAIIDRLRTDGYINNKEQGTLRRAILLPERQQGEWISTERGYECSKCGTLHVDDYPFCHMCGADMGGGRE